MRLQQHQQSSMTTMELVLPTKLLQLEELPLIQQLGGVQDGNLLLERGLKGTRLKKPIAVPLQKILVLGQRGLVEYIIGSLISQRPSLIPWVFENHTLVELAKHMHRSQSSSQMGLYTYLNNVSQYCRRLNTGPDQIIADIKPQGYQDPGRTRKHKAFLEEYLAELQDKGRSPGTLRNHSKEIRTWYRVNDVDIPGPSLPRRVVVNKDRAPSREELQRLLDIGDPRDRVIVSILALGGFREGTLARLQYRHVKEDLEANILPVHIHVEAAIAKGKYGDFDAFLSGEAVRYLKIYFEIRRQGSSELPPEDIIENSPLVRDSKSAIPKPVGEKQIYQLVHELYAKAGLLRKNENGRYDLRVHSIRKFYKTEMKNLRVDNDYIDYFMGHTVDTYHDIMSKGVEHLRSVYAQANLGITPQPKFTPREMLEKMVRSIGLDPGRVLNREALAEPHRIHATSPQPEEEEMRLLTKAFVDYVIEQVRKGPDISGPKNSALSWWGRWDLNPRPLAPISRGHQRPRFTVQDWTLVSSGRGQSP